jgi:uncharacterized protein (DUF2236 family)
MALDSYDYLSVRETQRLAAVKLFIQNVPNQPWPRNNSAFDKITDAESREYLTGDNVDRDDLDRLAAIYPLTFGRDLSPTFHYWINKDQSPNWAAELDEGMQAGRENKEISRLLQKAYPPLPEMEN